MIIGYYGAAFFGGGTYYKLSKKENEEKYKFEFCHSAVPNYIPNAEEFIKKYETLKIDEDRFREKFEGKIIEKYLELNPEILEILDIINNCDWNYISSQIYTSDNFDDVCWEFYLDNNNKLIKGYSVFPNEIEKILRIFKIIETSYIGKVEPNKRDLEIILSHKKSNLTFAKQMAKNNLLGYTKEKVKEEKEMYKEYEKRLKEIYKKEGRK